MLFNTVVAYAPLQPAPTIEEMIASYDWNYETAYAVAQEESGLNKDAYNPEWHKTCQGSYGIFQVACSHVANPQSLFDPQVNIKIAYNLWKKEGWRPWTVCTTGLVDCL